MFFAKTKQRVDVARPAWLSAELARVFLLALTVAALAGGVWSKPVTAQSAPREPRPFGAAAANGPLDPAALVRAEILPGWVQENGTRMAALRLVLAPGWKTYWRQPGETGVQPHFDWSRSQNVAAVISHWPRPEFFELGGFRTIGYADELILPLELVPERPGRPILLRGELFLGVCDELCVPVQLSVEATLRENGRSDPRIAAALAATARPAEEAGLAGSPRCFLEPAPRGYRLTVRAAIPVLGPVEELVVETPSGASVLHAKSWREGGELVAEARLFPAREGPLALERDRVRLTFLGAARPFEHMGCVGE